MDAVVARVPNLAADFAPRARMLIKELPEALDQLVGEAYQFAVQTMDGAPIHRAQPQPKPEPPAPPIERTAVYALSPLRWTERGQKMTCPRYGMANMPTDVAERAIARNLADVLGSERVRRLTDAFGIVNNVPQPDDLTISLDDTDKPAAEQQPSRTLPPGFVETVGQPRTVTIDAHRAQ
jgi:hypothetical protein